jgi:hypothetical protein
MIAMLHSLPELPYNNDYPNDDSDNPSDLGGAKGKPPSSLKQTKFSL